MSLNKQIWVKQIMNGFYPDRSFLNKVVSFNDFVEGDTLHIPSAGIDPEVLINNTTYPIPIVSREDTDNEITLDLFETQNTYIRRPEAIEYSYDKLESVIYQHRSTLQASTSKKAAHAFAPLKDTDKTPVILTSGEITNGRKRMTFEDLLRLKERFDNALIPLEDRYIILHPSHVTDLLLEDVKLFKQLTDIVDGEPMRFAGFGCYQFPFMPTYSEIDNVLTKIPFDETQSDNFASVAFQAKEVMKADGEIHMYSRYDDPEERATIVGFDKRFIAMPIRNMGIGAIVSATVEQSENEENGDDTE